MKATHALPFLLIAAAFFLSGCATAPETPAAKKGLNEEAQGALAQMKAKDPKLNDFLNRSYGYAIFPSVGKGGVVVGGAYGRGVVYEQGRMIGYSELNQASVGLQLGGQTYSELIVFQNEDALGRLKSGNFDVGASASAVALNAGASAAARFENGVAIFTMPQGGLMFDVSVTGQKLNFQAGTAPHTNNNNNNYNNDNNR
jgi:lipid-binding SYLF domain-containing protein